MIGLDEALSGSESKGIVGSQEGVEDQIYCVKRSAELQAGRKCRP